MCCVAKLVAHVNCSLQMLGWQAAGKSLRKDQLDPALDAGFRVPHCMPRCEGQLVCCSGVTLNGVYRVQSAARWQAAVSRPHPEPHDLDRGA